MGCRGRGARFMPGHYVFPGGGLQRGDFRAWPGESAGPDENAKTTIRALARAAIRETFEETGLLIGRPCRERSLHLDLPGQGRDLVTAFAAAGLAPAVDALHLIGRAITPARSPIRFHARFFLADAERTAGQPCAGDELEDVGFYPVRDGLPSPISEVTQFMLGRAIDICEGRALEATPLYSYVGHVPRVRWS